MWAAVDVDFRAVEDDVLLKVDRDLKQPRLA
jgi:hypothetical protein